MRKIGGLSLLIMFCYVSVSAQTTKPKIVVGIVIDQMRADYLTIFAQRYQQGGFEKLKKNGAWFRNCYINYLPSYTAPGHACIYTGTVPAIHGIVGNNWHDKKTGLPMYCVTDNVHKSVGGSYSAGYISPRNLQVTTVADELRLSNNYQSRTVAISLKDRGAVIPGGHTANAAYWMDDSLAHFMSSTYYMNALPNWVTKYNDADKAKQYLNMGWNASRPLKEYLYPNQDASNYEGKLGDNQNNQFPYTFKKQAVASIKKTPYGNSIVFDFAKSAVVNEQLGKGQQTDFLALSLSATDYIGHIFGPNSTEVEDTYLRLDAEIMDFLVFLDKQYGPDNYLLFLTADHGAAHNPAYLIDKKIPAGYFFANKEIVSLNDYLKKKFGHSKLCTTIENGQVYLDKSKIKDKKQKDELVKKVIEYFNQHDAVHAALDLEKINAVSLPTILKEYLVNSYYPPRCGDVAFLLKPAYLDAYANTGTSHGVWSAYDTQIPLLFYGLGIKNEVINEKVYMTDIAPTIANLLGIIAPNGCIGKPLLPRDK